MFAELAVQERTELKEVGLHENRRDRAVPVPPFRWRRNGAGTGTRCRWGWLGGILRDPLRPGPSDAVVLLAVREGLFGPGIPTAGPTLAAFTGSPSRAQLTRWIGEGGRQRPGAADVGGSPSVGARRGNWPPVRGSPIALRGNRFPEVPVLAAQLRGRGGGGPALAPRRASPALAGPGPGTPPREVCIRSGGRRRRMARASWPAGWHSRSRRFVRWAAGVRCHVAELGDGQTGRWRCCGWATQGGDPGGGPRPSAPLL